MVMVQRALQGRAALPRVWSVGVSFSAALVSRSASALGRFFVGSGGPGPRGYPREGFPEIELHEIMASRRDRFDGLL